MLTLTPSQQKAVELFDDFLKDDNAALFALLGYAGTGKSFLSGIFANKIRTQLRGQPWMWCAPTWKAVGVCSRFLTANGIEHQKGYNAKDPAHKTSDLILTSTASGVGLVPDMTESELVFKPSGKGCIDSLRPKFVVIDEISMLEFAHLRRILHAVKAVGGKLLIVGDPGQLLPVEGKAIPWDKIANKVYLAEVMRQKDGSAIPVAAEAVRKGNPWRGYASDRDLIEVDDAGDAFLAGLNSAPDPIELNRDVFIGYTNRNVNGIQTRACQQVYGHGADVFDNGYLVIAQNHLMGHYDRRIVSNQDALIVQRNYGAGEYGTIYGFKNLANDELLSAEFLETDEQKAEFQAQLKALKARAMRLEDEKDAAKADGESYGAIDKERRAAWRKYHELSKSTVLQIAHPFAITSHRSQGSTYRDVFVDATELERFTSRSLYVALTRASRAVHFS